MMDAHQSGKFNASTHTKSRLFKDLAEQVSIVVVTEAQDYSRVWGWNSHGRETKIYWKPDRWSLEYKGFSALEVGKWERGGQPRDKFVVPWVVLEHTELNLRVVRSGGHHPAHLYRKAQREANAAVVKQLPKFLMELEEVYKPNIITYTADFNLNLRSKRVQDRILQDLPPRYDLVIPRFNTHGIRVIDGGISTGTIPAVTPLPSYPDIDHRGFKFRATLR